jgi:hypothetical protein
VEWCVFVLLGVGFLLPWNAFITAIDYFEQLYPGCVAADERQPGVATPVN